MRIVSIGKQLEEQWDIFDFFFFLISLLYIL